MKYRTVSKAEEGFFMIGGGAISEGAGLFVSGKRFPLPIRLPGYADSTKYMAYIVI